MALARKCAAVLFAGFAAILSAGAASAGKIEVLHSFGHGIDGFSPYAGLVADHAGNLYGTTSYGGKWNAGIVFKLEPDGTETVIHDFRGGKDGATPIGGIVVDKSGRAYGTTSAGGASNLGTVFELAADGTETQLHAFSGSDGSYPAGGLIRDISGNLYGTTYLGGSHNGGTIFKISADGEFTMLHAFQGSDGAGPYAGLLLDKDGNLYGTTIAGGNAGGWGTIFKLAPDSSETVLHSFGATGLRWPSSTLVTDRAGNLYGTAEADSVGDRGGVFKITPDAEFDEICDFAGDDKNGALLTGVVLDKAGNLYGTTAYGGKTTCGLSEGCGTVFKIAPDGSETILHFFKTNSNRPFGAVMIGASGELYGTTYNGGRYAQGVYGGGVVFKIQP